MRRTHHHGGRRERPHLECRSTACHGFVSGLNPKRSSKRKNWAKSLAPCAQDPQTTAYRVRSGCRRHRVASRRSGGDLPAEAERVDDAPEKPAVFFTDRADHHRPRSHSTATVASRSSTSSSIRDVAPPTVSGLTLPREGDSSPTQNNAPPTRAARQPLPVHRSQRSETPRPHRTWPYSAPRSNACRSIRAADSAFSGRADRGIWRPAPKTLPPLDAGSADRSRCHPAWPHASIHRPRCCERGVTSERG
jgi:hypothetical protein